MFKFDVADFAACAAGVKAIEAALGPVEVLVNNAGITRDATMHRMNFEQWDAVIETNLTSCFNMSRAVIEGMRDAPLRPHRQYRLDQRPGRPVRPGQLRRRQVGHPRLHQGAGAGRRARGITVNAVAPGYVDTDMVRAVPPDVLEKIVARIPVGRLGTAEDIARTRAVPGRRRRRFHHRLDALGQRRPAHVLRRWVKGAGQRRRSSR